MKTVPVVLTAMALALGACGGVEQSDDVVPADDAAEHRHLLDAAQAPLERARQVEDANAARKSQLDEELKAAGDQ